MPTHGSNRYDERQRTSGCPCKVVKSSESSEVEYVNVRAVILSAVSLFIGVVLGLVIQLRSVSTDDVPSRVCWGRIHQYKRQFLESSVDAYGVAISPPKHDLKPDLAVLVSRGEILQYDLVLPTVDTGRAADLLWMRYASKHTDEFVHVVANPSYTDINIQERQPMHLIVWVKPTGIPLLRDLVAELKSIK